MLYYNNLDIHILIYHYILYNIIDIIYMYTFIIIYKFSIHKYEMGLWISSWSIVIV